MSGESKMGCRYNQFFCTAIHSSSISDTVFKVSFHASMRSSNGPLNAEKLMAWVVVMCSSKRAMYSSIPRNTEVPVSLYGSICSVMGSQPRSIASNEVSILNSLPATSLCFCIKSTSSCSCKSKTVCSVQSASGCTFLPDLWEIASQCRSRKPFWRKAMISGTCGTKALTSFKIVLVTSKHPGTLSNFFSHFLSVLKMVWALDSTASASNSAKGSVSQAACCLSQESTLSHMAPYGSNFF
mmetsp:Transcript_9795/g.28894  ORF Transcript_9795/g.28894 Transcript_9795/m.28894 type:complete len:240 (+) Transcript_9795:2142-2861(+)